LGPTSLLARARLVLINRFAFKVLPSCIEKIVARTASRKAFPTNHTAFHIFNAESPYFRIQKLVTALQDVENMCLGQLLALA
jgi:hypothetical protein